MFKRQKYGFNRRKIFQRVKKTFSKSLPTRQLHNSHKNVVWKVSEIESEVFKYKEISEKTIFCSKLARPEIKIRTKKLFFASNSCLIWLLFHLLNRTCSSVFRLTLISDDVSCCWSNKTERQQQKIETGTFIITMKTWTIIIGNFYTSSKLLYRCHNNKN